MRLLPVALFLAVPFAATAQNHLSPTTENIGPAALEKQSFILWEPEVVRHWPLTLETINIPATLQDLSPGQCFRVGAVARGRGHEHFLDGALLGFTVKYAGTASVQPVAAPAAMKHVKPEGTDEVVAGLRAAKVNANLSDLNSTLIASAGRWCLPDDAAVGSVEITPRVELKGKSTALETVKLQAIVPEMPPPFPAKDDHAEGQWMMEYHRHPQPALLGEAIDQAVTLRRLSSTLEDGFIAALKQDPASAARLGPWLTKADPGTQVAAVMFLQFAHVTLDKQVPLTEEQKASLAAFPTPDDPAKPSEDASQFDKLDRLWCQFMMTGDREPINALVSMLAWHKDYAAFERLKAAQEKGTGSEKPELTPEIIRGVAYTAAGWSLRSFQRNDGLASDYLAAIAADPSTPKQIRDELAALETNPLFDKQ